ncbi:MAG: amino acid ABC transporter ATP-binding protein [Bavariicoccus seileri]|uniref:amino acid ABC transporter ATP-binding protein n=1 Tax=Bavariicoccus seileri TaxID=549685 RepID=UPI0003B4BFEC|nr:amino acid ABC transporter ATP-binding protein [Bavariicoccus seileri]
MIEFQHVDKFYGDFHALKDINLTIDKGEVVTLIGPSGSGKSTLLRCINRLEAITKGKLLINDVDISAKDTDIRKIRRNIGMVFQHFELYPHMTVLKNITLAPRKVLHVDEKEAEERAERFLKRVNLWDKRNSYPNQLSGGQKQRVAIARGLAMNPEIMLFDEPTSALDPETTGDVLDVMQRIAEEDKMTMVVVTHEMGFAREVSDRTIFMAEGLILEDRPSQDFFNAPQDERAQQFLNQIIRH